MIFHGSFPYCGWLRNPAPPNGWLKAYKEWDVYHLSPGAGFRNHSIRIISFIGFSWGFINLNTGIFMIFDLHEPQHFHLFPIYLWIFDLHEPQHFHLFPIYLWIFDLHEPQHFHLFPIYLWIFDLHEPQHFHLFPIYLWIFDLHEPQHFHLFPIYLWIFDLHEPQHFPIGISKSIPTGMIHTGAYRRLWRYRKARSNRSAKKRASTRTLSGRTVKIANANFVAFLLLVLKWEDHGDWWIMMVN